ncbi:hypothetical protein ACFXJO_21865 [Streptomyces lavendulae]|uniref:hypothetical protein n=1 Tax=Streptomyces lavendulae TaxID=1914 RepID=UPI00367AAF4C
MRRFAPATLAVLLALGATAGCGGKDARPAAGHAASAAASPAGSPSAAPVKAPPLTEEEARKVVKDLSAKVEADSFDAEYWKGVTEGPLLEQQLAVVETARKYGTDRQPGPTNTPETDPAVHTWTTGRDDGGDRWILGAHELSGHTVGDSANETVLRWSLFHQQRTDSPWHASFVARAGDAKDLPQIAVGADGRAATGGDTSGLAANPADVCGRYGDYLHTDAGEGGVKWSKEVVSQHEALADGLKAERKSLGDPVRLEAGADTVRTPHGPVWRTTDGGALVACTTVSKLYTEMGPGRSTKFSSSGWAGTTGIPWASYTQRIMGLTVLKVPAGAAGEVSVAAQSHLPYSFEGTKYTG